MRYLYIIIFCMFSISAIGQVNFEFCKYIGGYWGNWNRCADLYNITGTYDNFVLHSCYSHPSNYLLKVKIFGFAEPDSKEKKLHLKNKKNYEYNGIIYYFCNSDIDNLNKWIEFFPYVLKASDENCTMRTSEAVISISPYKKRPTLYNIFFDNMAIALNLNY